MRRSLQELVIIGLLALAPALLSAWLRPRPAAPSAARTGPSFTVAAAQSLASQHPVLWLDARTPAAFAAGHIPGAKRLTLAEWESLLPAVVEAWSPDATLIVYCDSQTCDASQQVAVRLRRELPDSRIFVLEGGWEAWLQTRKHPNP